MYQEIRKLSYVLIATLVILGGLFAFQKDVAQAAVGINKKVNFQGKVTNTDGTNVATASYNFLFCIYTTATPVTACTAGANNDAVWRESKSLTVTDGIFQTNLGDTTAFAALVDFNSDNIFLGINFNSNGQMTPLVQFTASPYSFNSDLLDGGDWAVPGALGSTTRNSALFTTLGSNGNTTLASTGGSTMTLGNSTGTATIASGGASSWTNTSGNLTFSTSASGILALTSAGALNLSAASASTMALANVTDAFNFDSNTLSIDALNNRIGLGDTTPDHTLDVAGNIGLNSSSYINFGDTDGTGGYGIFDNGGTLQYKNSGGSWVNFGGGSGYSIIKDETTGLTSRSTLAFLGAGVSCADNGGQTECTIASGGAGPWTDGTGISYLTDTAEDLAIGGSALAAPFSVDVSTNTIRVGSGSTANGKIDMYASDGDTGSISYTANDTWAFEGGSVGIGTASVTGTSERMLQVGSETNRGNTVTYGEVATKGLKEIVPLADIKDVFMYDTTGDSDGGRWIDWATTDRLSWYTEAMDDGHNDPCNIATDDRCYSQSFPRKAILVVTGSALYIFDATNNTMWMKFSQNSAGYALGVDTNNNPSSVTALNGVIYVGTKGTSSGGLYAIDFVNDRMWNYDATDRAGANVGISDRNSAVTYASDAKTALQLDPVGTSAEWMNINDVAAVSVNSSLTPISIGTATTNTVPGLGQSFVALATDSGVTIINLAAQKLLQYSDVTADNYEAVSLTKSGRMYALNSTSDQAEKWDNFDSDKISEVNGAYTSRWLSNVGPALAIGTVAIQTDAPDALEVVERGSLSQDNYDLIYVGHNLGLTEIHDNAVVTNGWSKFYNTTRQTMLMPNAIDSALMLDETSGTVAQDVSFNNTDMEYKGTVSLGVNGVRGKGVGLNATGYLCSNANAGTDSTCDNDASFNSTTAAFNVGMWFKHSTTLPATSQVLFEKCYNNTGVATVGCVTMYMTTAGVVVGAIDATTTFTQFSAYDQMATSSLTYNDDQWHYILMSRDNAADINVYIDGQALNTNTFAHQTATVDAAAQIVSVGASCVATTDCVTTANRWDGSIDDFFFSSGATTVSNLLSAPARRLYNDARPLVGKRTINVVDASSASSTTLQKTSSGWIPNEFAGLIVEITSGTGAGQSRRVVANNTDTLTVSPAFDVAPDTTSDFEIDPESLYGASDIVNGIGVTAESPLGEARMMCAGTNSTTDTGGVTCYNHQAGPNVVAEVFHSNAKKIDDLSNEWTGTNYDNIKSVDLSGRSLIIGSMGHTYTRTEDVRLGQGLDYLASQLFNIRGEIIQDGIALTGSLGLEVGFTGGADLAEYYRSPETLEAGMIVGIGDEGSDSIKKTTLPYQKDVLGIVATAPGMILGTREEDSYPVALAGRVPIKVTTENGIIFKGDQITSSSLAGFGMVAIEAGRVIGTVLEEVDMTTFQDCPVEAGLPIGTKCGEAVVFVNLNDFSGMKVEDLMSKKGYDMLSQNSDFSNIFSNAISQDATAENSSGVFQSQWTNIFKATNTLGFLNKLNDPATGMSMNSEILAKNINATGSVVSPLIVTDTLVAKHIKAETIEGLEFIQTGIDSANNAAQANTSQVKNLGQQLSELQSSVKLLSEQNKNVDESLATVQGLSVEKDAEFNGIAIFKSMVSFIDRVIFKNKVEFEGQVTFNKDSAGFAVIKEGTDSVGIEFENEYAFIPVINASLSLQSIENDEVRKASEELLLVSDVKFIITNVTTKGFEIRISQKAISDIPFSWQTIAIRNAKTFESKIPLLASDKNEMFQDSKIEVTPIEVAAPVIENNISVQETQEPAVENIISEASSDSVQIAGLDMVQ